MLVGGSFAAFVVVKGSYRGASVEDGSVFRIMMPSFPFFVLVLAALPLLLPHAPRRLSDWREAFAKRPAHIRGAAVALAVVVTAVAPLAGFAAASQKGGSAESASITAGAMVIPVNVDLELRAAVSGKRVVLHWRDGGAAGGPVFYRVWRGPAAAGDGFGCDAAYPGGRQCLIGLPEVGVSRTGTFVDRPRRGDWIYRIGVAANWLDDPGYGDVYLVGKPIRVRVG
jgi:hypothetical protein